MPDLKLAIITYATDSGLARQGVLIRLTSVQTYKYISITASFEVVKYMKTAIDSITIVYFFVCAFDSKDDTVY
jgi:hypothetical protein